MGMLEGKRILLGICGSIAAYKSAFIVREFIKKGAEVQVILTPSALRFVTPLTLATLSKRPALSELVADEERGVWNNHVDLGNGADLMLIAPASAHTLAKMARGEADNLLLTTYLSAPCPVFFAPAMDLDMHAHPANTENIELLEKRGNIQIPAESGELASGLSGTGRMAEPEHIAGFLENYFAEKAPLRGKRVLITAGPTYEAIDPVRFIGNHSSGKMGFALAAVFAKAGAEVTLIAGPVSRDTPRGVERINVTSAAEMFDATLPRFEKADIALLSAAVADYRPSAPAETKMKKKDAVLQIDLEPTKDILKTLGGMKRDGQVLVGFALETENAEANARGKLEAKNCDLIVLNSLQDEGAGFGHDTNKVTLIGHNKKMVLGLKSKEETAGDILDHILTELL
ncbi:MAG: bifunctional phosphopantothenoylcysteine decarboxylase/phosphopantothenate--cysteine ligase CoaBC [Cryomorphaceae bacterium]|nr:bifunctional phosphopantothenoylcysteine decarboxylase/phosphopantothenate--cysteine ligase CoaBC [Flavobacteriales bacterium]